MQQSYYSTLRKSNLPIQHILFADDDEDDCMLFKEALDELSIAAKISFVYNGDALMQLLNSTSHLPDIVFLDLNMPRKNGLKCLVEIKANERLKNLPVVIYSTSYQKDAVDLLYKYGAQFYIRKPNEFSELKNVIFETLTSVVELNYVQPSQEKFVLSHEHY